MNKAQCNCLEERLEPLREHITKKDPKVDGKSIHWGNVPMVVFGGEPLPYMTATYNKVGVKRDFTVNVFMNYCPFCGAEYLECHPEPVEGSSLVTPKS